MAAETAHVLSRPCQGEGGHNHRWLKSRSRRRRGLGRADRATSKPISMPTPPILTPSRAIVSETEAGGRRDNWGGRSSILPPSIIRATTPIVRLMPEPADAAQDRIDGGTAREPFAQGLD